MHCRPLSIVTGDMSMQMCCTDSLLRSVGYAVLCCAVLAACSLMQGLGCSSLVGLLLFFFFFCSNYALRVVKLHKSNSNAHLFHAYLTSTSSLSVFSLCLALSAAAAARLSAPRAFCFRRASASQRNRMPSRRCLSACMQTPHAALAIKHAHLHSLLDKHALSTMWRLSVHILQPGSRAWTVDARAAKDAASALWPPSIGQSKNVHSATWQPSIDTVPSDGQARKRHTLTIEHAILTGHEHAWACTASAHVQCWTMLSWKCTCTLRASSHCTVSSLEQDMP